MKPSANQKLVYPDHNWKYRQSFVLNAECSLLRWVDGNKKRTLSI
jgi:hypothetical protein